MGSSDRLEYILSTIMTHQHHAICNSSTTNMQTEFPSNRISFAFQLFKDIKYQNLTTPIINNDEHLNTYFGYDRLRRTIENMCSMLDKCKQCSKQLAAEIKHAKHQYWIDHKDQLMKKRWQLQTAEHEREGKRKYFNRCYNMPVDELSCPSGKTYSACGLCL